MNGHGQLQMMENHYCGTTLSSIL